MTGYIYAYSYPSVYRPDAPSKIKVGFTEGDDPWVRVKQQVTAQAERPIFLRSYKVGAAKAVEKLVHSSLTPAKGAVGTEWFLTTVEEVDAIIESVVNKKPKPRKPKLPRPHQVEAVNAIAGALEIADRAQLIMATGSGKTLTCLWISERLSSGATLLLFPSIALASQTLKVWKANAKTPFDAIVVCSDETAGKSDSIDEIESIDRNLALVSTDPIVVQQFLSKGGVGPKVVFSTYQSSPVVAEAAKPIGFVFDLAIADEAHRTAGKPDVAFALILGDEIRAKKRLFATATPRVFRSDGDDLQMINCMSAEEVYGRVGFNLDVRDAIDRGLLAPYRISVVGIPRADLDRTARLNSVNQRVTTLEQIACGVAQQKVTQKFKHRSALTFHSSNARAAVYAEVLPNLGLGEYKAEAISGLVKVTDREKALARLADGVPSAPTSLSSCQILSEGVDVPAVDLVVFADPKGSRVSIIQSVGRGLRPDPSNPDKVATVLIGVPIPDDGDTTEIDRSAFSRVFEVVNALQSVDPRLHEELVRIRREKGRTGAFAPRENQILTIDLPEDYSEEFAERVTALIIRGVTSSFDERLEGLRAFLVANKRMPNRNSEDPVEKSLGVWINQSLVKKHPRAAEILALVAELGIETKLGKTKTSDERFGELRAFLGASKQMPNKYSEDPAEKSLGQWVAQSLVKKHPRAAEILALAAELGIETKIGKTKTSDERIEELRAFLVANKRMPNMKSVDPAERSLGKWINLRFGKKHPRAAEILALVAELGVDTKVGSKYRTNL